MVFFRLMARWMILQVVFILPPFQTANKSWGLQRVSSRTSASTVSFSVWFGTEDNLFRQTWRSSCIGGSSYSVMIRELFLSCFELPVNYSHLVESLAEWCHSHFFSSISA